MSRERNIGSIMSNYHSTCNYWKNKHKNTLYSTAENNNKNNKITQELVNKFGPRMKNVHTFCELGVGSGRNISLFNKSYPEWSYSGNDIAEDIVGLININYPKLTECAKIYSIDTLSFLKKKHSYDILFTHGHLMHLPDSIIKTVCELISVNTNKYILIREAYTNGRGIPLLKKLKYKRYRFDRDYEGYFTGFILKEKQITEHPYKKGMRQCVYFFENSSNTD